MARVQKVRTFRRGEYVVTEVGYFDTETQTMPTAHERAPTDAEREAFLKTEAAEQELLEKSDDSEETEEVDETDTEGKVSKKKRAKHK